MSDDRLPADLDRWTLDVHITGDDKAGCIRRLERLAAAMEREPDGYTSGCSSDRTRWHFAYNADALTGRDRTDAIWAWMKAKREALD